MSYNVSHSEYLSGKLFITREAARRLKIKLVEDLAEGNFLSELELEGEGRDPLPIENLWWYGEWSGHGYESALAEILRETTGEAVILFIWEGGDDTTALHVKDGVVTKKKPKVTVEDLP